jgi:hypothetical protein
MYPLKDIESLIVQFVGPSDEWVLGNELSNPEVLMGIKLEGGGEGLTSYGREMVRAGRFALPQTVWKTIVLLLHHASMVIMSSSSGLNGDSTRRELKWLRELSDLRLNIYYVFVQVYNTFSGHLPISYVVDQQ